MTCLLAIALAGMQPLAGSQDMSADAAARGLHFGEFRNQPHAFNMNRLQSGQYRDDDDEADERYGFRNGQVMSRGVIGTGMSSGTMNMPQQNHFQNQQQSSFDTQRFGDLNNRNSQQGVMNRS